VSGVLHDLLAELRSDPAAAAELRTALAAGPVAYTPQTLAAELGVTPRAVRAAIGRGDLQARRSGRGWVISADAVAAWAQPHARVRRRPAARRSRPLRDAVAGLTIDP
jgi:excisionase family DNA binding protein